MVYHRQRNVSPGIPHLWLCPASPVSLSAIESHLGGLRFHRLGVCRDFILYLPQSIRKTPGAPIDVAFDVNTQTILLYLFTWTLVAITPGPAAIYSMSTASRHGFRASLAGVAGIQAGNFVFFAAISCGLAALLAQMAATFAVVRLIGGCYLIYLGVRIILSTIRRKSSAPTAISVNAAPSNLFFQGLAIQLTNPKALLFVSALLPQFIDSSRLLAPQLIALASITVLVDFAVLSTYAFLANHSFRFLRNSSVFAFLEGLLGTVFVLFGMRVIASRK